MSTLSDSSKKLAYKVAQTFSSLKNRKKLGTKQKQMTKNTQSFEE